MDLYLCNACDKLMNKWLTFRTFWRNPHLQTKSSNFELFAGYLHQKPVAKNYLDSEVGCQNAACQLRSTFMKYHSIIVLLDLKFKGVKLSSRIERRGDRKKIKRNNFLVYVTGTKVYIYKFGEFSKGV